MKPTAQSATFFRAVADSATIAILAFDEQTRACVYINRLGRETLELPLEDGDVLPDLALDDLATAEPRPPWRAFSVSLWDHEGLVEDVAVQRVHGGPLIANVGTRRIALESGDTVLLLLLQDVTFQKKLQREVQAKQEAIRDAYQELLTQNRQLKELDIAKDRFVALTTHELRTPLSAIVGTAEALHLGLCESDEQRALFIRTIHEQSIQLMELVNDVLDFAKVRIGKMEYYVENSLLEPIARKTIDAYAQMAEQAGVTISLESEPEVRAWVDVVRFREILANVLSNAIKYNRRGGSVLVSIEQPVGLTIARVSVRDTGPGIPADRLESVFNEFETLGSVSRHHKGTGLGMPISRRLARDLGGELNVQSEEGVGSTFSIEIPTERVLSPELYRARPDAWGDFAV